MSESETFSWSSDKDSVIIDRVDAVAVYVNPRAEVVVRQEDRLGGEDSIIIVPKERIPSLIAALEAAQKEAENM